MKTVNILGKKIELYDAIEDLPIVRYNKYNKMLLIDAGVGSDIADIDRHIEKAMRYARSRTPELAVTELQNLRQNLYLVQSEVSPRHLAFVVLVKSIDGEPCDDLSEDGLRKTLERIADMPVSKLVALLEAAKKKIETELQLYFPALSDNAEVKEYYDMLRRRTMLLLDSIRNGETADKRKEIAEATDELLLYVKPRTFDGPDSAEITHDKQFEKMCLIISHELHVDPKKYTVLEFYNAFEYIKEIAKERKKALKRK